MLKNNRLLNNKKILLCVCSVILGIIIIFLGKQQNNSVNTDNTVNEESYFQMTEHTIKQMVVQITGDEEADVYVTWKEETQNSFLGETSQSTTPESIAVFCANGNDPKEQLELIAAFRDIWQISSNRIFIGRKT